MTDETPLVLVVDDDEAGRFTKVQRLQRAGYRVTEASTGADALRLAAESNPDLVLLDVNLPDIHGMEVCRRLKQMPRVPALQVVHLSSTSISDSDRVRGLSGGADAYLTEPINTDVLLATIGALLRVRRAEKAMAAAMLKEQEARAAAEQANRFKDDFLAALSHELRTPLSAMVGWIWQLRNSIVDEPLRRRALDALERSTTLQARLINDLLDVSRIGKGKLELEFIDVRLAEVIELAAESVQAVARARKVLLSISIVPVSVRGDAARLHQIVVNLLTNAIQFSDENGRIELDLIATDSEAVITVHDNGQGISSDLLPYVFDQFRQGDQGFSRRHGGLGLGLAIVKQLVSLHGGSVEAASPGPGLGSTFTVRLPLDSSLHTGDTQQAGPSAARLHRARILIVDDDDDSRTWLSAVVASAGGSAATAGSAAMALERLAAERFDVLVSDIGMPDADGLTLIKRVRTGGSEIPAVAVTAFSSPAEVTKILAAGYQLHFAKPIQPDEFVRRLQSLLEGAASQTN